MYCEVCRGLGTHRPGCPEGLSFTEKPNKICYECHDGIYVDDEYIENENGDAIHYDCSYNMTTKQLVEWLGFEIKRIKEYD